MHESMAWNVARNAEGQWHASRGGGVEDLAFDSLGAAIGYVRDRNSEASGASRPPWDAVARWMSVAGLAMLLTSGAVLIALAS